MPRVPGLAGARGPRGPLREHRRPDGSGAARRRAHAGGLGRARHARPDDRRAATNVRSRTRPTCRSATSAETFAPIYRFFTGRRPAPGHRAASAASPSRAGRRCSRRTSASGDRTLEVWEVTAHRAAKAASTGGARSTSPTTAPGARFRAEQRRALRVRARRPGTDHAPPLLRALPAQRPPGAPAHLGARRRGQHADREGPRHSALTIVRYKELWGDQGAESDVLDQRHERDQRGHGADHKRVIGMFAFDTGSDGVSNVATPHPGVLRAPVPERRGPVHPGRRPPTGKVSVASGRAGRGPFGR